MFHPIFVLNSNPTLSKDRFTRITCMLYVEPKVRLCRAMDNEFSLKLRCYCAVSCVSQAIGERLKKKWIKH